MPILMHELEAYISSQEQMLTTLRKSINENPKYRSIYAHILLVPGSSNEFRNYIHFFYKPGHHSPEIYLLCNPSSVVSDMDGNSSISSGEAVPDCEIGSPGIAASLIVNVAVGRERLSEVG